jgi:type I restriction enzyme, R subunit
MVASRGNRRNYKDRLEPLRDKRMVFIFDECHRSQFGENHKAIKEFFPKAQLFGFTGTANTKQGSNGNLVWTSISDGVIRRTDRFM